MPFWQYRVRRLLAAKSNEFISIQAPLPSLFNVFVLLEKSETAGIYYKIVHESTLFRLIGAGLFFVLLAHDDASSLFGSIGSISTIISR